MFKDLNHVRKDKVATINDPILGVMRWSDGERLWESKVVATGKNIRFLISGDSKPDRALISHAHDLVRTLPDFEKRVTDFLANEAHDRLKGCRDEIDELTIECICLFWPDRPNDGMIYFRGPNELRVWRCDYVDRKPVGLGFDA
jgi:hypothetical protein